MALLIPKRFESTARLMPPDQASSGMAMLASVLHFALYIKEQIISRSKLVTRGIL
jgi:hypothetical protein